MLKATWDDAPTLPPFDELHARMQSGPTQDSVVLQKGDAAKALASGGQTVTFSGLGPYQAHAPFAPNCALADVKAGGAEVICSSQDIYTLRRELSALLGLPQDSVRVKFAPGSGTYGHSCYDDVAQAAAAMSQLAKAPVRVQFMRWDEHGWEQFGPATAVDVKAGIDAKGKIVAYDYTSWTHGSMSVESSAELSGVPLPTTPAIGRADTTSSGSFYAIPHRRVTGKGVAMQDGFLKGTYLRAPNAPQSLFASEQIVDQLAYEAKMDPFAFRSLNLNDTDGDRWQGVMDAVAAAAKWQPRVSGSNRGSGNVVTGRGVAIGGFARSYPALVADIEVNKKTGKILVKHLYAAQDAGLTVNPAAAENQMSGCLIQGCSRALLEEVRFNKVRQTSVDWASYPILRFKDSPSVTTVIVQRVNEPSTGSGEPATAAVAAAIANAFFDATGVRLYSAPMNPARVRAALAAAK
jgi:CO/xanthine dehydrogenase Mo-binding subunit